MNTLNAIKTEAFTNGRYTYRAKNMVEVTCIYDEEDNSFIWLTDGICVSEIQVLKFLPN